MTAFGETMQPHQIAFNSMQQGVGRARRGALLGCGLSARPQPDAFAVDTFAIDKLVTDTDIDANQARGVGGTIALVKN